VAARLPGAVVLDPEPIGVELRADLDPGLDDFQVLPEWRAATVAAVAAAGPTVVVPMTVVDPGVLDETVGELRRRGADVRHATLVVSPATLRARLAARDWDTRWAASRVDHCVAALTEERFAVHLDGERPLREVVEDVVALATKPL
jgi:hypothetical protein